MLKRESRAGQLLAAAMLMFTTAFSGHALAAERFTEGAHYSVVESLKPSESLPSITKYIWIGCPYCIDVNPLLAQAQANHEGLSIDVRHSVRNPNWERDARIFSALQIENRTDTVDGLMVHYVERRRGGEAIDEIDLLPYLAKQGVDAEAVSQLMYGEQVNAMIEEAKREDRVIDIQAVPTLVINNRYAIKQHDDIKTVADQLALIDYLLAK
ncbi:DsbA family protein [Ferrimonas marina]|uniref:DSBA-like thioredoxin domain-containing protein n=1 Tax=Ferrimonas marina TaxID=299255 RepID=A0A1M5X7H0_9GAMM|nr:DsbA family protein [Ferrimonas marina]SHH95716.1 DSBA-like thioredoxin domain-containing protein [Ferrimonas marina]